MKLTEIRFKDTKLKPIRARWYEIVEDTVAILKFDNGKCLVIDVKAGFQFDGRSGGILVDWFVPNLGKQAETWCFLVHDVLFYNFGISFKQTNDIFYQQMRLSAKYNKFKAGTVVFFVSIFGKSAFGNNTESEELNKRYINAYWIDSEDAHHMNIDR